MNVAIIGLGVVGRGVYDILSNDFNHIHVKYVVELDEEKLKGINASKVVTFNTVLEDETIDVIIELIGGKTVAYDMIKLALQYKKHVVTANKAVISEYYEELTKLAKEKNVSLLYEASVGGAIIVLEPLYTISKVNKIHKIEGILNGSTNYVLTKLFKEGKELKEALDEVLELGYIETGSTDDMDGFDLLRKINIISMISYQTYIKEEDILRVPLSSITHAFYERVKEMNCTMKYIATSYIVDDDIRISLEPVILDESNVFNSINYEENIVNVYGKYHKKQSFIGAGAGRYPTGSAVINDLIVLYENKVKTLDYSKKYTINKTSTKQRYLVERNNGFMIEIATISSLLEDKSVICFARMDCDYYE
jgi:homoserine dehydrogenase